MSTNDSNSDLSDDYDSAQDSTIGETADSSYARYIATLEALDRKIIPRLVKRFGAIQRKESLAGTDAEIEWMAQTLIKGDLPATLERCRQLLDCGWTTKQLYLDLLGGAARKLGNMWEADLITFVTVTIAAAQLRELMEELTPEFEADDDDDVPYRGRLMLSPVTGSQHILGAKMAASFFKRAGWDVIFTNGDDRNRFAEAAGDQEIELVGFSIASENNLEALRADITYIRDFFGKRNRRPPILVGGALITSKPSVATECGADGFAVDAGQALIVAQGYLPSFSAT